MVVDLQKIVKENKKLKEKKSKESSKNILKKGFSNNDVVKKTHLTLKLPEHKVENVFEDENRFFKGNFDKEKRSMFLS